MKLTYRILVGISFCLWMSSHDLAASDGSDEKKAMTGEGRIEPFHLSFPAGELEDIIQARIPVNTGANSPAEISRSLSSPSGWETILFDGFENGFPVLTWIIRNFRPSTPYYWEDTDYKACSGSRSVYCAAGTSGGTAVPNGGPYMPNMRTGFFCGPFDLSDPAIDDAVLEFDHWTETEWCCDALFWGVFAPDSGMRGEKYSGFTGGWQHQVLDLKNIPDYGSVIGKSNIWIVFVFVSDATKEFEGSYIDNVLFKMHTIPKPADLVLKQLTVSTMQWQCGNNIDVDVTVQNSGETATPAFHCQLYLSREIAFGPGGKPLGRPIAFDPLNPGATGTKSRSFSVPAVTNGNYYIGINIDHNSEVTESDENNYFVHPSQASVNCQQTLALSVTPGSWEAPVAGGTSPAVTVTNAGGSDVIHYTISDDASWLTVSTAAGSTPGSFTMTANANNTGAVRNAVVTVTSTTSSVTGSPQDVLVTQPSAPALQVDPTTWAAPADGGISPGFYVTDFITGDLINYTITDNADWLSTSQTSGTTPGNFTIQAQKNISGVSRSGIVTVTATTSGVSNSPCTVIVTQGSANQIAELSVIPTKWTAPPCGASTTEFTVLNSGSSDALDYAVTDDADWLSTVVHSSRTPGGFTLRVESNDTPGNRTGTLTVKVEEPGVMGAPFAVTITQRSCAREANIGVISPETAVSGHDFYVDVFIDDAGPVTNLFDVSFVLQYWDKTQMDFISAEPGPFLGADVEVQSIPDGAAGRVNITISRRAPAPGVDGSGVIVRVKFRLVHGLPDATSAVFMVSEPSAHDPIGDSIPIEPLAESDTFIFAETGVARSGSLPLDFQLCQNYPNPFNPVTTITFELPAREMVNLEVLDMLGCTVTVLLNEVKGPGRHDIKLDASFLETGVYVCRLTAGAFIANKKLIVMK